MHAIDNALNKHTAKVQSRTQQLVKRAPGCFHVLTLSHSEQVAEVGVGRLGGRRLEALNLTQHEVIVSGQI